MTLPEDPVLEAALRVIGRRGLEALTHRAAAAEAGVSLGAVTHRHRRRDDLARAALDFAVARETARADAFALRLQSQAFDLAAWSAAVAAWYAREMEERAEVHAACCEALLAAGRDPRLRPTLERWIAAWRRAPALALRAAGDPEPEAGAAVLVDAVLGAVMRQLAVPDPDFEPRLRATLTRLCAARAEPAGPPAD
ncbi:TetR family transcriptional regulator [Albimonas sp. CAU 1670]|uniref:TetR/AcrR family transcriptional regulator n=1 Tax=Albimonas sp. CAU 1670 TaxID=3032599 RepID=UPI0023DA19BC|nr:TetR family transcriptional regulator [Albimonas sp. CAU 1670]MDF2231381.1 TetR family transcriptional regulator [Albimonas sp. CAU 1670]